MISPQLLPQRRVGCGRQGARNKAALILALVLCAAPGAAEEAWQVRVDCPELDAEARAQLEVRHLVELQGLPGEPKTMVLRCAAATLEGSWERDGVVLSRRSVSRTPNDDVLELAHWLASVLIGVGSEGPPADHDEAGVAPAKPAPAPVAPPPHEPVRRSKQAGSRQLQPAEPESLPPMSKDSELHGSSRGSWDLGLGAGYQHYAAQVPGSLGPSAYGTWRVLPRVGLGGAFGYQWGVRSTEGVTLEEGGLALHARIAMLNWLGLLAGPSVTLVTFRRSEEQGDGSANALSVGGELFVRAETPARGWGGFVALGLRLLLPEQEVRVGGDTVLELPSLRGGVTLGLRYEN